MMQAPNDELTVQELNAQVRTLVHFLRALLRQYGQGLRRYRALMLVLALLAVGGSVAYSWQSSRIFEGKALYAYTSLQRKLYGEAIDNVNDLLQTHSYSQLQPILHLDRQQLGTIKSIEATNNVGSKLSDDLTENNAKIFYLSVKTTNQQVFQRLDTVLEHYLNQNIAVQELQQQRVEKFKSAITYRQKELVALDSLTHAYTASLTKPSTAMFSSQKDPVSAQSLLEKGERITEEIADMQSFLEDPRAVKLQRPFLVSEMPMHKSAAKIAAMAMGIFLVLSGILVFGLPHLSKQTHASQ